MNVSLTPELEKFVNDQVASGMYYSASEVVREGLRLLKEQELYRSLKFHELRQEIQKGIDSSKSGKNELFDVEAIKVEGRKRMAARKHKSE